MDNKTARPNRFIMNSDFMTLAKSARFEKNIVIPTMEFMPYSQGQYDAIASSIVDVDEIQAPKGAIARTSVAYKGTDQTGETRAGLVGSGFSIVDQWYNGIQWNISLYRESGGKLRVQATALHFRRFPALELCPSITFKLIVSYFYPPNV